MEPAAVTVQNVTMFPVLIRIANEQALLRPGMNSEVDIEIGEAGQVLTVPNAALRTPRDVASAASVLGLDMEIVNGQLEAARQSGNDRPEGAPIGEHGASDDGAPNTITLRGREVTLPAGVTREQMQPILEKMANGNFQNLSSGERALMQRVMRAAGGGPGRGGQTGGRRGRQPSSGSQYQFGAEYIVFTLRGGEPTAVAIETGLTDLDYSEVRSGLTISDTVLVLPSASLISQQQQMQERIQRMTGGVGGGVGCVPRGSLGDTRLIEFGRVRQRKKDHVAPVQFVVSGRLDGRHQIADARYAQQRQRRRARGGHALALEKQATRLLVEQPQQRKAQIGRASCRERV